MTLLRQAFDAEALFMWCARFVIVAFALGAAGLVAATIWVVNR